MTRKEVEKNHNLVCEDIVSDKIKDALDILQGMVDETKKGDFKTMLDNGISTYENILKYTIEGIKDPQRQNIYQHLQISLLKLCDRVKENLLVSDSKMNIYALKAKQDRQTKLTKNDAIEIVDNLLFNHEIENVLETSSVETGSNITNELSHSEALVKIFNTIWFTDMFNEGNIELIRNIAKEKKLPWFEKSLVVSALTLSVLRCFDPKKVELIFDFYDEYENQVWQRALIGLLIVLYQYEKRLNLYPGIRNKITELSENPGTEKDIEKVVLQLIKAKETEKLTKKFREEIVPEVIKIKPRIEDKLDLGKLFKDDFSDDKNPDWETFFEDTPEVFEKLEEFSKLQMEGSDVFLSAFAMLKHFDFFNDISNWFTPFHKNNEAVRKVIKEEKDFVNTELLVDSLVNSAFLCNSDKYSF